MAKQTASATPARPPRSPGHVPESTPEVLARLPEVLERVKARIEEFAVRFVEHLERSAPRLADDKEALEVLRELSAVNTLYGLDAALVATKGRVVRWDPDEPKEAGESARFMAKRGIPLEQLLRAYRAAHSVIFDITTEEIRAIGLAEPAQAMMVSGTSHSQFAYFDHLISLVTEAYTAESERMARGKEQRRVEMVSRLLSGDEVSSSELGYQLEVHHLALVVQGAGAEQSVRALAARTGHNSLLVSRSEELAWLWLGSPKAFSEGFWERLAERPFPEGTRIGAGEAHYGAEGFRLSHRQAEIAASARWDGERPIVRYADVALIATVLSDETARASFAATYLGELAEPGERNETLRATLRAYFKHANAASAAAALGVHERTVRHRLVAAAEILGHPPDERRAELEVALRIVAARPA